MRSRPTGRRARAASPGDLGEDVCEPVDLLRGALLRDGDEQRVVEALVVASERVPGVYAALSRGPDDLGSGPSDAHGKLLERWPIREHELEAGLREPPLRVLAER